jgi:ragulator complex protein LAMTOR3
LLKKYFRVNGLKVIIISDRDGVPLLRISKDSKFPELGTKQNFLATFSVANEQSNKMGIGRNESIISMYKSTVVRA